MRPSTVTPQRIGQACDRASVVFSGRIVGSRNIVIDTMDGMLPTTRMVVEARPPTGSGGFVEMVLGMGHLPDGTRMSGSSAPQPSAMSEQVFVIGIPSGEPGVLHAPPNIVGLLFIHDGKVIDRQGLPVRCPRGVSCKGARPDGSLTLDTLNHLCPASDRISDPKWTFLEKQPTGDRVVPPEEWILYLPPDMIQGLHPEIKKLYDRARREKEGTK